MKKRVVIQGVVGMLVMTLVEAILIASIMILPHEEMSEFEYRITLAICVAICILADIIWGVLVRKEVKNIKKMEDTVTSILSEESDTEVIPKENCDDAYVFNFLQNICTFYARIEGENKIHIIGKIQYKGEFIDIRSFRYISFAKFLRQYEVKD